MSQKEQTVGSSRFDIISRSSQPAPPRVRRRLGTLASDFADQVPRARNRGEMLDIEAIGTVFNDVNPSILAHQLESESITSFHRWHQKRKRLIDRVLRP